jgi:hypothetical protein
MLLSYSLGKASPHIRVSKAVVSQLNELNVRFPSIATKSGRTVIGQEPPSSEARQCPLSTHSGL